MADARASRAAPSRAAPSPAHAALAILVPFAFLAALDGLLRGALLGNVVPRPAAGFRVLVLLAGAVEVASASFLRRERLEGFGARLRELLLVLAGTGLAAWLLSGRPFRGEPSPVSFAVVWPMLLAGVQWLVTLSVQRALAERELFLHLVGGRAGPSLATAAREAAGEAGAAAEGLARLRRMVVGFDVTVAALLILALVAREGGGGWWVPVAVAHEILGLLALGTLAAFEHQQVLVAAGIPADVRHLRGRVAIAVAATAAVSVGAAVAAGGRPVLPLSILATFLAWLNRLFARTPAPEERPGVRPPSEGGGGGDEMREMLEQIAREGSPAWLELALKIAGYALAAGAIAGAAYFLVRPLLRRDARAALGAAHPLASLRRALARLAAFLAGTPRALRALMREGRREAAAVLRAAAAGAGTRGARAAGVRSAGATRGAAARPVRDFVRLVRWGERRGVRFDRSEGPLAYATRLGEAVPAQRAALAAAAVAFERIVYGGAPAPGEERELAVRVRAVVTGKT